MPHAPRTLARVLAITVLAIGALTGCGSTSEGSAGIAASPNPAPSTPASAASSMNSIPIAPAGSDSTPSDRATTVPSTGSTSAPSPAGSDSTAIAGGGVGAAPNAGGADLSGDAVCATLPAQTAKQLTGLDITQALPLAAGPDSGDGCGYSSDDSSVQVQVQVFSSGSAMDSWEAVSQGSNNTTITGLGDKAFYDNDGTLYALKDSRLLQVNGVDTQDQAVALATAVLPLL